MIDWSVVSFAPISSQYVIKDGCYMTSIRGTDVSTVGQSLPLSPQDARSCKNWQKIFESIVDVERIDHLAIVAGQFLVFY